MSARCIGEPISWLRLEQHHLGEGSIDERAAIAKHVGECAACAAALASLREGDAASLPPIVFPTARPRARRWNVVAAAGASLALAASFALVARDVPKSHDAGTLASRAKGGAIAFSLIREDGARIDGDAGVYRDGDRFHALVTCPPGDPLAVDLAVYDDDGASFPLAPPGALACGNDVALKGAFRLTGHGREEVCLVWGDGETIARDRIGPNVADTHRTCISLTGSAEPR